MKKFRNALSLTLVVLMLSSIVLIPSAAAPTTSEKADVLNKLAILKGDGTGNYALSSQLKRNEAAAFITRLLGQEQHVLENTINYNSTGFKDVPKISWYAAYVGYCSEKGIIAGVGDNLYLPDEYISEKAFLKLVLVALGYEYGTDFLWSQVYSKAYQAGLVTDTAYLTKTADNYSYTRESVVKALYASLTLAKNSTGVTLLQTLVNDGAISLATAVSTGLMGSSTPTTPTTDVISQIQAISSTMVMINFSKPVTGVTAANIKIYETGDITKQLTPSVLSFANNVLIIKTSEQKAYEKYSIEIKNINVDAATTTSTAVASFSGFRASAVTSDFFKISTAVATSYNTLQLYFTHPVNTNSELASFYEILDASGNVFASGTSGSLSASYASTPNNMVTITLNGKTFVNGDKYTIKVSGALTSIYGVRLVEGSGDLFQFAGVSTVSAPTTGALLLTSSTVLDYKTLQLQFNKELHPTRAQQVFSYYITDSANNPIAISSAVLTGAGAYKNMQVHLTVSGAFVVGQTYKVLINEVNDLSRTNSIINTSYTFTGTSAAVTTLRVSSVSALDRGVVTVMFNKPLDPATATNINYYIVNGGIGTGVAGTGYSSFPAYVYHDAENSPNAVKLYMPLTNPLTAGTFKLTVVAAMKDYSGAFSGSSLEANFTGSTAATVKPVLSDAVIISSDTIKVNFSKEIAVSAPNILASNYSLTYVVNGVTMTKLPLIAGYINNTTLVLKFDALDNTIPYTLKFKSLTDYSGMYTRTEAEGGNTFAVRAGV